MVLAVFGPIVFGEPKELFFEINEKDYTQEHHKWISVSDKPFSVFSSDEGGTYIMLKPLNDIKMTIDSIIVIGEDIVVRLNEDTNLELRHEQNIVRIGVLDYTQRIVFMSDGEVLKEFRLNDVNSKQKNNLNGLFGSIHNN